MMTGPDLVRVLADIILVLGYAFIAYSVLINTSFAILTALAMSDYIGHRRRADFAAYDESFAEPLARGISVLMPAYNEELTIVESVQAMIALRYPDFEVVVVDDGSTDATVERLIEAFDLIEVPIVVGTDIPAKGRVRRVLLSPQGSMNLVVVCKDNGGKADALNVGINASRKELVCMVDADSLLDPDSLLHVSRPFADDPDRVLAAGGVVRVANGSRIRDGRVIDIRMPTRWLPRIQTVEYLRAFLIGRAGWSSFGGLLIISGAFGIFRRDILLRLNGLDTTCIGEDAELVVRLYRMIGDEDLDGRVVFVSEPVAWTEAPESLRILRKQRRRWHRGLTEIFMRHSSMLFRPKYGVIGMVTLPWFFLFELLAPVVEVFGLFYFAVVMTLLALEGVGWIPWDLVDVRVVVVLLATSIVYAVLLSLTALIAEELSFRRYRGMRDLLISCWVAVEENIGYRQLNAWWRFGGLVEGLRQKRPDWGDMQRKGFKS